MKIAAVIVTYNRLKDLVATLEAYEAQTLAPQRVMVIDNHSTDGTTEYLNEWAGQAGRFDRAVFTLPENVGGSGGFSFGMTEALKTDSDWIFVADDDAVPRPDMFEKLAAFAEAHPDLARQAAALCTGVYNQDHFSGIHRCVLRHTAFGIFESYVPESEYLREWFEFDIYSFVGSMIRADALKAAGVARADFFIYNDDYEHALRLRRYGKLICVPGSVMDHTDNLTYARQATWRDYYGTRNGIIMHRIHFGAYAGFWRAMRRLAVALAACNGEKLKVITAGMRDGFRERTGIHPVYKPGWTAKKQSEK